MGLFSSKKKIYVSSVVYNLAGDFQDRSSYLKTSVAGAILQPDGKTSVGDALRDAQLRGPSMDQRSFFRWARSNYTKGMLSGQVSNKLNVNVDRVRPHIPVPAGHVLYLQAAHLDTGDFVYWAERWLMENRPERYLEEWACDHNPLTNSLLIQYPDNTSETVALGADYNPDANYVFAYYGTANLSDQGVRTNGQVIERDLTQPSTESFAETSSRTYPENVLLINRVQTTVSAPGQDPVVTTEFSNQRVPFVGTEEEWFAREARPEGGSSTRIIEDYTYLWFRSYPDIVTSVDTEVIDEGGGQTRTIETVTQTLRTVWSHRTDVLEGVVLDDIGDNQRLFIYRIGSGINALDTLQQQRRPMSEFFPVIPLRIDNQSISQMGEDFVQYERAYKRATGAKIDEILENIEDNESIGDIDYAFLVHGVEANTQEAAGKRYIYEFLRELIPVQRTTPADMAAWEATTRAEHQAFLDQLSERELDLYLGRGIPDRGDSYRPPYRPRTMPSISTVTMETPGDSNIRFKVNLSWITLDENIHAGLGRAGARKGDFWWDTSLPPANSGGIPYATPDYLTNFLMSALTNNTEMSRVRLYWQYADNAYRYIEVTGMVHENFVYPTKTVITSLRDGVLDTEESQFFFPLHYETMRQLPLVTMNELAGSSRLVVFNCYQIVRVRWYQRGIFKILLGVVISLIFFPAGIGVLGANLAVGVAMGLSGTAALIAGAVANAIAATILSMVIQSGATFIFGEKLGAIIGALATAFAFQYIGSFHATGSWSSFNWGDMLRSENLLKLTDAVAGGVSKMAQAEMGDIAEQSTTAAREYQNAMGDIERKMQEYLGYSGVALDPLLFGNMQDSSLNSIESSATFLTRTLLTGSEIADLSITMIGSFPELSLALPKAIE